MLLVAHLVGTELAELADDALTRLAVTFSIFVKFNPLFFYSTKMVRAYLVLKGLHLLPLNALYLSADGHSS